MVIVFARPLDPRRWALATQIFALQVAVAVIVVAGGLGAAFLQARNAGEEQARQRVLAVAHTLATDPAVVAAVATPDPTAALQAYMERVRVETTTDFIVVMNPDGVRWTHPDPTQIGKVFIGHIEAARAGEDLTEDYVGTLGPSTRSVVPVFAGADHAGPVIALVSVGITLAAVSSGLGAQVPGLLLAAALAALIADIGTWLVARHVRRETRGMNTTDLRQMYEYYDAVLHAVREGLLLIDRDGRVQLVNDEARRLLALPDDVAGRRVADLGLMPDLAAALADGAPRTDELHVTTARVVVLNQARAQWAGRDLGTVATLRDRTDLEALTGELDSARGLADALHAQAHESANRLHTVVSLIELGRSDEALRFATDELTSSQKLTDSFVAAVHEPALTALLLGKAAQASERGVDFQIEPDSELPEGVAPSRDLVTIVGNLVDNALDAVAGVSTPRVTFGARLEHNAYVLTVGDNGAGLTADQAARAFTRGWSSKPTRSPASATEPTEPGVPAEPGELKDLGMPGGARVGRGLGLALVQQCAARLGGDVAVSSPPGATFTVRLPLRPTTRAAAPAQGSGLLT